MAVGGPVQAGAARGLVLPAPADPVWAKVPLALRQDLRQSAHQLVSPARGPLEGSAGRRVRSAVQAAAQLRTTGAHWHVLLTSPQTAFGGPRSARAQALYEHLERIVTHYLQPALERTAAADARATVPPSEVTAQDVPADQDHPAAASVPGPSVGTAAASPEKQLAEEPPTTATAVAVQAAVPATLHQARGTLPQLIKAAITGTNTPLARGAHHALLTSPAEAARLGWNPTGAAVHGIADARKRLGDLIQHAAQGHPQVLRRHTTPVAVLLPAAPDGTPLTPDALSPTSAPGNTQSDTSPVPPASTPLADLAAEHLATSPAEGMELGPSEATASVAASSTPQAAEGCDLAPAVPGSVTAPVLDQTAASSAPATRGSELPPAYGPAAPSPTPSATTSTAEAALSSGRTARVFLAADPARDVAPTAADFAVAAAAESSEASLPKRRQPIQQPDPGLAHGVPTAPAAAPPGTLPPQPAEAASSAGPSAVVARVRTPRRLAALAQALDDVLAPNPATKASGELTTPTLAPGLATGIRALDEALGGLQPGRFYLVAAAPGAGSSLIATTAARTTALEHHRPVLYAASGLTRHDVASRVTAAHLPVDYQRLRTGRLTITEQQDVAALHDQLTAAPLYIDDGTDLTTDAISESMPDIPGLALVVVDRLQAAADPRLPLSGPDQITDAAQALAHLARTHGIPVLAAVDTDDPHLLAALTLDVTLVLVRDTDQVHVTVTERDLGVQATVALRADLAHARITDPAPPSLPTTAPSPAPAADRTPPGPPPAAVVAQLPESPDAPEQAAQEPPQPLTAPPMPDPAAPAAPQADAPRPPAAKSPQAAGSGGYAGRDYSYFTGMIARAVDQALQENGGDVEAATAALVKKAVPNAMALFEETRVGSNYDHTVYPEMPEFLRKKTRDGVDEIWEGRHNWTNTAFLDQLQAGTLPPVTVDALDTNASFLSAFKTYLPIGALVHNPTGGHDSKRSGIYLLHRRPAWLHPHLPDPIGNRQEEGPVLLDEATVRLLIRCAGYKLCEVPVIAESWTSGASEGLLEKFRRVLTEAREAALRREADGNADGTVTVEYIKAMYSKFTSTMGQSSANLEIRRPEWMHIVRSQAFANLWYKAYKAHKSGLVVVRVRGTDELHVTGGEWRKATGGGGGVFEEGRLTTQMKLKSQYPFPRKTSR